jgi:hypothetical protein
MAIYCRGRCHYCKNLHTPWLVARLLIDRRAGPYARISSSSISPPTLNDSLNASELSPFHASPPILWRVAPKISHPCQRAWIHFSQSSVYGCANLRCCVRGCCRYWLFHGQDPTISWFGHCSVACNLYGLQHRSMPCVQFHRSLCSPRVYGGWSMGFQRSCLIVRQLYLRWHATRSTRCQLGTCQRSWKPGSNIWRLSLPFNRRPKVLARIRSHQVSLFILLNDMK